jgi:hypothetical protein
VENVLLGDDSCQVPFLSDTYEGSRHDKPIADQTPYPLAKGSELLQDLGFVGFRLEGIDITMPHKKPRGGEISAEQKAENRVIAHRRVEWAKEAQRMERQLPRARDTGWLQKTNDLAREAVSCNAGSGGTVRLR